MLTKCQVRVSVKKYVLRCVYLKPKIVWLDLESHITSQHELLAAHLSQDSSVLDYIFIYKWHVILFLHFELYAKTFNYKIYYL